jgi:hypothetical protein
MVSRLDKDVDLAKRAKVIEWLKTEIIDQMAHLFKGIWEGSQHKITDALASMIVCCYILGRRLGVSFRSLDELIMEKLNRHKIDGHQLEDWYQDISVLEEHMRNKR